MQISLKVTPWPLECVEKFTLVLRDFITHITHPPAEKGHCPLLVLSSYDCVIQDLC